MLHRIFINREDQSPQWLHTEPERRSSVWLSSENCHEFSRKLGKRSCPPSLCWLLPFASAEAVGPHLSGDSHQQVHPEEKSNPNRGGQENLPSMYCSLHIDCYGTNLEIAPKGSDRDIVWVQWTGYKFLSVCQL